MPDQHRLDLRAVRRAIAGAREVVDWFGTHAITSAETTYLLQRHQVRVYLEDLPEKYAAMLSPVPFKGTRSLSLARHVPHLGRRLVLLHENGHLYMGTAQLGITYSNDDWRTPAEQGADAFAAVALVPTRFVDLSLSTLIWERDVEDDVAAHLLDWSEGLWEEERALTAARNRLLIRQRLGV